MVNLVLTEEALANEKRIVTEELRLRYENNPENRALVAGARRGPEWAPLCGTSRRHQGGHRPGDARPVPSVLRPLLRPAQRPSGCRRSGGRRGAVGGRAGAVRALAVHRRGAHGRARAVRLDVAGGGGTDGGHTASGSGRLGIRAAGCRLRRLRRRAVDAQHAPPLRRLRGSIGSGAPPSAVRPRDRHARPARRWLSARHRGAAVSTQGHGASLHRRGCRRTVVAGLAHRCELGCGPDAGCCLGSGRGPIDPARWWLPLARRIGGAGRVVWRSIHGNGSKPSPPTTWQGRTAATSATPGLCGCTSTPREFLGTCPGSAGSTRLPAGWGSRRDVPHSVCRRRCCFRLVGIRACRQRSRGLGRVDVGRRYAGDPHGGPARVLGVPDRRLSGRSVVAVGACEPGPRGVRDPALRPAGCAAAAGGCLGGGIDRAHVQSGRNRLRFRLGRGLRRSG